MMRVYYACNLQCDSRSDTHISVFYTETTYLMLSSSIIIATDGLRQQDLIDTCLEISSCLNGIISEPLFLRMLTNSQPLNHLEKADKLSIL